MTYIFSRKVSIHVEYIHTQTYIGSYSYFRMKYLTESNLKQKKIFWLTFQRNTIHCSGITSYQIWELAASPEFAVRKQRKIHASAQLTAVSQTPLSYSAASSQPMWCCYCPHSGCVFLMLLKLTPRQEQNKCKDPKA